MGFIQHFNNFCIGSIPCFGFFSVGCGHIVVKAATHRFEFVHKTGSAGIGSLKTDLTVIGTGTENTDMRIVVDSRIFLQYLQFVLNQRGRNIFSFSVSYEYINGILQCLCIILIFRTSLFVSFSEVGLTVALCSEQFLFCIQKSA